MIGLRGLCQHSEFHELRAVVILIIQRLDVSESCELCKLLYKPTLVA